MSRLQLFLCFCFALLMSFQSGLAFCKGNWNRKIKSKAAVGTYETIFVGQSGHANFTSIQKAINSISTNNRNWVCIYIKAGTYREKVKIPDDKPYIIMKGEGKKKTRVVWDDHESVTQSPTFMSSADNIVVKSMSFVNSYNSPNSNNPRGPAVAAMITGDKCTFYRCGFYGVQDTLWDDQGRHYFKKCTIQGAVDFIFGSGQSIYEGCSIQVLGNSLEPGLSGFITAQGRTNPNDANGFVFKGCKVFGFGSAFLGRPWRGYARVLFYNSNFTNVVQPNGWDAWTFSGHENRLFFAEHSNYGPGASTAERVSWEKKLSSDEVNQLTSMTFIDRDGWLEKQPF